MENGAASYFHPLIKIHSDSVWPEVQSKEVQTCSVLEVGKGTPFLYHSQK